MTSAHLKPHKLISPSWNQSIGASSTHPPQWVFVPPAFPPLTSWNSLVVCWNMWFVCGVLSRGVVAPLSNVVLSERTWMFCKRFLNFGIYCFLTLPKPVWQFYENCSIYSSFFFSCLCVTWAILLQIRSSTRGGRRRSMALNCFHFPTNRSKKPYRSWFEPIVPYYQNFSAHCNVCPWVWRALYSND